MTLPNFLIIGSGKAGTTSLQRYLAQHPEIYISPVKETNFFALEGETLRFRGPGDEHAKGASITRLDEYEALFAGVTTEKAVGEIAPYYLYSDKAAENIRRHVPDARLIAILRHPAERAYSSYVMKLRDGVETLKSFEEAMSAEAERIAAGWGSMHYVSAGFYYEQLRRYYDRFRKEQLKVFLYEDFRNDPLAVLRELFTFLDVDPDFAPDMGARFNISGVPRSRTLHGMLKGRNRLKTTLRGLMPRTVRGKAKTRLNELNLERRPMPLATRRALVDIYRTDILRLQDLIERDLSHWLQ